MSYRLVSFVGHKRITGSILLICGILLLPLWSLAQAPFIGDSLDQQRYDLNPQMRMLEDPDQSFTIEDWAKLAYTLPDTARFVGENFIELNPESAWWMSIKLTSSLSIPSDWMLINDGVGMVDVWLVDSLNQIQHWRSGRYLKAEEKVLNLGDFIHIPFRLEPAHTYRLLIRMAEIDHQAIKPNWRLYEPAYWYAARFEMRAKSEKYRFFQGIFWIMILYNLVLFFRLSQRAYLYYAGYLLCLSGFVAFAVGTMTYPSWGDPRWLTPLGYLAFGGINVFYYQFGRQFLDLKQLLPRWDRILAIYVSVKIALLIAVQIQMYSYFSIPIALGVEFSMLLVDVLLNLVFFVAILRTKSTLGYYFVAGSASVIVLGMSSAVLGHLFPLAGSFTFFLISIVIEMIFFSLGLSYRIRQNEQAKLVAEQDKRTAQEALNRELSKINSAFGRFVPHEFIRSLGYESILDVNLGDSVEKEVTVLFSDIRGYTTLSENMSPQENFHFLNDYLGRMGPVIQANQGFVNQYYGDGIMALFLQHPEDALKAAIEMLASLDAFNEERALDEKPPIHIGIGLHTGPLMMGVIGDTLRLEAGVVSDTVNTTARMEGLTKFYQSRLLLSGRTRTGIAAIENYEVRFLGKVQVKGRKEPVWVYECFSEDLPALRKAKTQTRQAFEQALEAYFEADFPKALRLLDEVLQTFPDDISALRYRSYCLEYLINGTPPEWTGVEAMQDK